VRVEHDRRHFKGILGSMECEVWHAIEFNAKAKPVERFFGTYEEQFGKMEHTYCGRNPQEKPEHLEERLEKGEAPTFRAVRAARCHLDRPGLSHPDPQRPRHGRPP
jgi:hypothetical protein